MSWGSVVVNDFSFFEIHVVRHVLIDQTKTRSLTSIEESTLYRGQRPTLGCFLSSKL